MSSDDGSEYPGPPVRFCRQCFSTYLPNPDPDVGYDDGFCFCSDYCEQQYYKELSDSGGVVGSTTVTIAATDHLSESKPTTPKCPRGCFTLDEVDVLLRQAYESVLRCADLKFDDPPSLALEKYIEEARALFGMQHDTETSDNV